MINQRMADAWAAVEAAIKARYTGPMPIDDLTGVELIAAVAKVGAVSGPAFTMAQQLLIHADDLDTVPDEFVGRCATLVHMLENPEVQARMIDVNRNMEWLRRSQQY